MLTCLLMVVNFNIKKKEKSLIEALHLFHTCISKLKVDLMKQQACNQGFSWPCPTGCACMSLGWNCRNIEVLALQASMAH